MKDMVIAGLVTSAVPIILSLFMPNWYLGDAQNAVDGLDITGKKVEDVATVQPSGQKTDTKA